MAKDFTVRIRKFVDENGVSFLVIKIQSKKKRNLKKNMVIAGIEIVSEAALATYVWRSNFHPAWILMVSTMGTVSFIGFYRNVRRYIRGLPRLIRDRLWFSCCLSAGVFTYFASIHVFSEALKRNSKVWIPCLGFAAYGYYLAASSVTSLGRTVLNRSPHTKCCQLLFGPALIGCAGLYFRFRQHDENWVFCLPFVASAIVADFIGVSAHIEVESNDEPRWLLFKGLEMFVSGCILAMDGFALLAYSVNNQFFPLLNIFFLIMISNGCTDILDSFRCFGGYVEMAEPVFSCICGMVYGPVIFLSACVSVRCICHLVMLPIFFIIAGTGIFVLGKSILDLHDRVPPPVYKRYCQRVLGPVATVYGSLVASYVGYSMGWKSSLVVLPFISAGIYATYRGFKS